MKNKKKNSIQNFILVLAIVLFLIVLSCLIYLDKKYADSLIMATGNLSENDTVEIVFNKNGISSTDSNCVIIDGTTAYIINPGRYKLSGECENGRIIYDTKDNPEKSEITFSGLSLGCANGPVFSSLGAGDINLILDGENLLNNYCDTKNGAAFYSKKDITINGKGTLNVISSADDGISVRGDLKIKTGNIIIEASQDGIDVKDDVKISGGNILINASKDGINAKNKDNPNIGRIIITGGKTSINAKDDALSAAEGINVKSGVVKLKASGEMLKTDGELKIADDCVFANYGGN